MIFKHSVCLIQQIQYYFQMTVLCHGGRVGFFRGDPKLLVEDIQALKPTLLPMVPRLLNRIYDKVH